MYQQEQSYSIFKKKKVKNFELVKGGAQYILFFCSNWAILLTSHWLYWKYTGRAYGRSLGQRAFRIAIVHDNVRGACESPSRRGR